MTNEEQANAEKLAAAIAELIENNAEEFAELLDDGESEIVVTNVAAREDCAGVKFEVELHDDDEDDDRDDVTMDVTMRIEGVKVH